MNINLSYKVVLITGGSKGIGLSCAKAFAGTHGRVAIASRQQENLASARQYLISCGFDAQTYEADLTDAKQAATLVESVEADLGSIDILINAAGAAKRHSPNTLKPQHWVDAMNAKYFTYINSMHSVLNRRSARQTGIIVNIMGAGGKNPHPIHLPGGAANAALMLATTGLAAVWAEHGIRINGINPGPTQTERIQGSFDAEAEMRRISSEEVLKEFTQRLPIGRLALPEEIANVAVFLSSNLASYIIGEIITMDGAAHPTIC